jgi:nicotinamide mononucleotide (NMN) deamidase PncC
MNLVAAMFRFVSSSPNVESETSLSFLGGVGGEGGRKAKERGRIIIFCTQLKDAVRT